jgi:hypothetical protein
MRRAASTLPTALLACLLVAACASRPSPTPRPSIPPARVPFAAAYLDLVAQSNKETCEFNAALSQSAPTLPDLKQASGT